MHQTVGAEIPAGGGADGPRVRCGTVSRSHRAASRCSRPRPGGR